MDIVNSHLHFNSKYRDKCKFALKLIPLATTSNVFSLEFVQNCQHCQLGVLRENSNCGYLLKEIESCDTQMC